MRLADRFSGKQGQLRQLGGAGNTRRIGKRMIICRRHRSGLGQHVVATQTFVTSKHAAQARGHIVCRCRFALHHVRVKLGRTAYGLAGVVDDEVEALARLDQFVAERFHARRVAQIESEYFQAIGPVAEVFFLRVTRCRVAWKPCCHDQAGACAQKFQARLIADFDATACQQRDTPA